LGSSVPGDLKRSLMKRYEITWRYSKIDSSDRE